MIAFSVAALRSEFQELVRSRALTPDLAERLSAQAAQACLDAPEELDEAAGLLCEVAALPEPEMARAGVEGIFRHAVESMGDAFDPRLCDLYIEFFARVIQHARALPRAAAFDVELRGFGLLTAQDLIDRARAVRRMRRVPPAMIRKILVLSRVTLGADVAITSVVLRKMMLLFPTAQLVLLGGHKTAQLFAGERRLAARPVEYPRGGGLLDRLQSWLALVEAVRAEIAELALEEYMVIDPDSRLTQLGMLPVVRDESPYYFLESRSFSRPGVETLAELTAAWLEEVFGTTVESPRPWIKLAALAPPRPGRWASINLGAGENPRKRIPDPFEQRLLGRLLSAGWKIYLDKGDGPDETERADRLLQQLQNAGARVATISGGGNAPAAADVVAWKGSLAGFASLIAASDLYIGYDSACQHIAAALGVKTVDIFAGFRSPRMVERWRPVGAGEVRMVVVDPDQPADPEKVLAATLEAAQ